ncbi:hypothetical protein Ae201684P_016258 [Aphanomyces euteiches]|uniref:BZIP domain-containing protein n=1 Tax=Aphanomyces euteiches TaxID=100861 RepID=A0A6G0XIS5_9STRA|nr:hypothetical protein Ae201684_004414 [Aphanomyces euteiches]KAH9093632.1 hypothetical protein Ae201684P_016258 [Aphanomyces euteiches]KAH9140804.1 hypothetical protein AeRB84_014983 [Aphanomyces euteiches]
MNQATSPSNSPSSSSSSSEALAAERLAKRRARSMISQRKYRANQKASNDQLVHDVRALELMTVTLEARLVVLQERQGVSIMVNAIKEYLALFQHGYHPFGPDSSLTQRQEAFLHRIMSPNVEFMGNVGVVPVLESGATFTSLFSNYQVVTQHIQVLSITDDDVLIEANCTIHVQISATTIQSLFPQLIRRHDNSDILDKLIGKALQLPTRYVFVFNIASRQVIRLDIFASIAAAFVEQLQSIDAACDALQGVMKDEVLLRLQQLGYG